MTAIQVSLKGGLLLQIQRQYIFFPIHLGDQNIFSF